MNKRSILNNLFKLHKFRQSIEFSKNVEKYMNVAVPLIVSKKASQESLVGSLEMGSLEISFLVYEKIDDIMAN